MTLRKRLIRLAHDNPELRPHVLPLVKEGASGWSAALAHDPMFAIASPIAKQLEKFTAQAVDSIDPGGSISLDNGMVVFLTPGMKLGVTVSTPEVDMDGYQTGTMTDESKDFSWGIKLSAIVRWVIQTVNARARDLAD
jgi:hypothetical protein